MAGLSLSGLASGMDTDAVVGALMAIEAQGKNRLIAQQYKIEARKTALNDVAIKLRGLRAAADDLKSVGMWQNVQTVESSDAAKISVAYKSGAPVGSYTINVLQLARAEQRWLEFDNSASAGNTLTLGYDGDPSSNVVITYDDTTTVEELATKINGLSGSPAFASVVDGRLVLSGKKTGVGLSVVSDDLTSAEGGSLDRAALKARYTIDGGPVMESESNTVTGLVGVEMTFKSLTDGVTVTIGPPGADQAAIKEKVTAFVNTYNSLVDFIREKLTEEPVKEPATKADYAKGVLRGDAALTGVLSELRRVMAEALGGGVPTSDGSDYDALAELGISVPAAQSSGSVSADRLAGKLVIDEAKLTAALTGDPARVRAFFAGADGSIGFSQKIADIINPLAAAGTGMLAERASMADRELARNKDAQSVMDTRLALKEARLRAQFTAMETALSSIQNTTSWLSSQIAGLPTWSSSD